MNTKWIVVLFCTALLTGCSHRHAPPVKANCQRFVPIPADTVMTEGVPWHGFFALDTKTGTLCVTLEFKDFPKGVSEWANGIPKCNNIWRNDHD
jgi:hypothetical protein